MSSGFQGACMSDYRLNYHGIFVMCKLPETVLFLL